MRHYADWTRDSLCLNMPADAFYLDNVHRESKGYIEEFLPCRFCPVKKDCLDYSIIYDEDGIWGGETKGTRNSIAKSYVVFDGRLKRYRDTLAIEAISRGYLENHPDPAVQEYLLARLYDVQQLHQQRQQNQAKENMQQQELQPGHTSRTLRKAPDPLSSLDLFFAELDECIQ